jgi:hypothetical protein
MRLRSTLNLQEQPNLVEGPTKYTKGPNRWGLICGTCGETYYVDEVTFAQFSSAMENGFENPFFCPDCEAESEELSH